MITLTAKIYISETEVINIDRRNLIGISSSIYDRSDLKLPSFGIISNIGNIDFNDSDGQVLKYAENLKLQAGQKCEIWLHNTLVETANERIGEFETDQWNYDNDSRVVSVSIKDDLEEWQEINVEGLDYQGEKYASYFYNYLRSIAYENYAIPHITDLDEGTQNILKNTYIKHFFIKSGNLWEQWVKLCQICQLHIYKDKNGIIVCKYNGGN